jgi:hypothetical protein
MMDDTAVATADYNARHWAFPKPGQARPGSQEHFEMFTELLEETYNPYKPAVLDWPALEPDALRRITSLPIWDIAVQTENKAGARIEFYSHTVKEHPLRQALVHMAGEERRHRDVLARLVAAYGIKVKPDEEYALPNNAEWGFLVTGYSECLDSFFAFGLFEMARQSGYFPEALVETFEPVVQEEARHIIFFTNFIAWKRATMAWWKRPLFELKVAAVYAYLLWERIGVAKDVDGLEGADANFTVNGSESIAGEMDPAKLIDICFAENDRRLAGYDPRLKRPVTAPTLARLARLFIRPKK